MNRARNSFARLSVALAIFALHAAFIPVETSLLAQEVRPQFLMSSDPKFEVPQPRQDLPAGIINLWRNTLQRSEPELVKAAADCMTKAQEQGFPGMDECVDDLISALKTGKSHRDVRFAVSRAIVRIDPSAAPELLWETSQAGELPFKMLVEPAMASLEHQPAIDVWVSRLTEPMTSRRELLLACEGISVTKAEDAVQPLVAIAVDRSRDDDIRLAAARAAGDISTNGMTDAAETLVQGALIDSLCAVSLLQHHSSEKAQRLLERLATNDASVVSAPALRSLLAIDPKLVLPFAKSAVEHADQTVRQCGLDAYVGTVNEERLPLIARMLDDVHIDVRISARKALFGFCEDDTWREMILKLAAESLHGQAWRAQEQAAILLVGLNHKDDALRFVELLDAERPEVFVTAAWGLRVLAVPETADGILDKVKRESADKPSIPHGDRQLGHLFEACAVLNDKRALPSITLHVPKDVDRPYSRCGAIWAAGKLLEEEPDEQLAAALMGRIKDVTSIVPELNVVRRMSAITLGRMKDESQLNELRRLAGSVIRPTEVDHALGWAIEQITGEALPIASAPPRVRIGWQIQPATIE